MSLRVNCMRVAIVCTVLAVSRLVAAQSASQWPLPTLVLRAWVDPLRTNPPSDSTDRTLVNVASLSGQARFAEADAMLQPLLRETPLRTQVAARLFELILTATQVRVTSGGQDQFLL